MTKPAPTPIATVDALWEALPPTGTWNTAANWNPAMVPTGTATFATSSQTTIGFDQVQPGQQSPPVGGIAFAAGAPSYTLLLNQPAPNDPALTINGAGIANSSGGTQQIVVASSAVKYTEPQLRFTGSASAGGQNVAYEVGPTTPSAAGGGAIQFCENSTAGSASFTIRTGAGTPPKHNSTVGGEVGFSDTSNAGTARFLVYGTTGSDGDTFGNAAFHDSSSAAGAVFTNAGGTVYQGDGGNTQFFDNSTAASGLYHNEGGTVKGAYGGDVAFDSTANGRNGHFHNYAATADGGSGGVTSFNNNPPYMNPSTLGASAGSGLFFNYGAKASGQGGGHTFFTAKSGSPTAAQGTFVNYGSAVSGTASAAGHTVLSITLPQETPYCPDAGDATFWNFPGTAPGAPGGNTQLTVYSDKGAPISGSKGPTAGSATFINLGAIASGAGGGQTTFGGTSSAEHATLIALGGAAGGEGGWITFMSESSGGTASVSLSGNGTLDLSSHDAPGVTIGSLSLAGGCIRTTVGSGTTCLSVSGNVSISASPVAFAFVAGSGFATNTPYTVLTAPNLSSLSASRFSGNALPQGSPTFAIVGNELQVTFGP